MLDVIMTILALIAGGLLFELLFATPAPLGYEDEQGFPLAADPRNAA
jgi:hypothetical protein